MAGPGPDGPVAGVVYMERVPDDPGDLIHPLRVLGMSLGCTSWMSYSHDGLKANAVADPKLEEEVCALIDILPVDYKDSFMIFDYGMYPPLVYLDRGAAHDSAFAWMEAKVKNQYDVRNFLLIGKQINPEDKTVEFRVKLKLPRTGPFGGMNLTLEGAFQAQILELLAANYSVLGGAPEIQSAEEAGIEKLTQLLVAFLEGDFNGGITEEILILNGFEELIIGASTEFNLIKDSSDVDTSGNLKDYARRKVYYATGEVWVLIGTYAKLGMDSLLARDTLTSATILTDNSNYSPGIGNYFEKASRNFEELNQHFIVWLHYYTPEDTNKPNKLFLKFRDNLDQQRAEEIVQKEYESYTSPTSPDAVTKPNEALLKFPGDTCVHGDCGFNTCWRMDTCVLPYIDDWFDFELLISIDPSFEQVSLEVAREIFNYQAGVVSGLVDGLIETLFFVGDAVDFIKRPFKHLPCTTPWFSELFVKVKRTGSFRRALKLQIKEDSAFWQGVYVSVSQFVNNLKNIIDVNNLKFILQTLWGQFKSWVGDLLFQSGTKWAGYTAGKLLFDIIIDFLTGGTSKVGQMAKSILKDLISEVKSDGLIGFSAVLEDAWKYSKGPKKTICKLLLGGCFVEGTAVWTASGVFSIEKLEPVHAPFFNPPGELRMVAPKVIFQVIPIR